MQGNNNKKKIVNDPVYGFISITHEVLFDLIEHPYFQRLRRIKQLGMTHNVYPGAHHTRFHHAMGAMHLMTKAVSTIRRKGTEITLAEEEAVLIAILLHDIGHGPFSHALEHTIVSGISHEEISILFMQRLNTEFDGKLSLAIEIFKNQYSKPFLHQLVSSQLDMDRLDYLNRDSFFTGVSEGIIGSDRIIEMLDVRNGYLVLEEKGIYSIEKFIVARRLMYWQVYMHKTVVSAENMLIHILQRAKELSQMGVDLFASPALKQFLQNNYSDKDFTENHEILDSFSKLDDFDITCSIKVWQDHEDSILSDLSTRLINRKLFKIEIGKAPYSKEYLDQLRTKISSQFNLNEEAIKHYVYADRLSNSAYNEGKENINLLLKDGSIKDLAIASDNLNISALSSPVEKFFICYPS